MQIISQLKSLIVGAKTNEKHNKLSGLIEKCNAFIENNNALHLDDKTIIEEVQKFVLNLSKNKTLNTNTSNSLLSVEFTRSKVYLLVCTYSILMNHSSFTNIDFRKFINFLVNCKIFENIENKEIKKLKDLDYHNYNSSSPIKEIKYIKKYFDEFTNIRNIKISSNFFAKKYNTYNIKEIKAKIVNRYSTALKDSNLCPIILAEKEHEEKQQLLKNHKKSKDFYNLIDNFLALEIIKKSNVKDIENMLDNYPSSESYNFIWDCQKIFSNNLIISKLLKNDTIIGKENKLLNIKLLANIDHIDTLLDKEYINIAWLLENKDLISQINNHEFKNLDKILSNKYYLNVMLNNSSKQEIITMFCQLKNNKYEKFNTFLNQEIYTINEFDQYVKDINKLDYITFNQENIYESYTNYDKKIKTFTNIILANPILIKYIEKLNTLFDKFTSNNIDTLNKLKTFEKIYIAMILNANLSEQTTEDCVNTIFDYNKIKMRRRNGTLTSLSSFYNDKPSILKSSSKEDTKLRQSTNSLFSTDDEKSTNTLTKVLPSDTNKAENLQSNLYIKNAIEFFSTCKENMRYILVAHGFTLEYIIQNYQIIKPKINYLAKLPLNIIKNALNKTEENKDLTLNYFINLDIKYLELSSNSTFIRNLKNILFIDIFENTIENIEELKKYPIENLAILSYKDIDTNILGNIKDVKNNKNLTEVENYKKEINNIFKKNYNLIDRDKQSIFNQYWNKIPENDKLILKNYLNLDTNGEITKLIPKKVVDELFKKIISNETALLLNEFTESKFLHLITSKETEKLFELTKKNTQMSIIDLINFEFTGTAIKIKNQLIRTNNKKPLEDIIKKFELLIRPFKIYMHYKNKYIDHGDSLGHMVLDNFIKPNIIDIATPIIANMM